MVLQATWRSNEADRQTQFRFETPVGCGVAWLREKGGVGELVLRVDVASGGHYIEPRKYCALGAVGFWDVPEIRGSSAKLRLTAIPRGWLDHSDEVLWIFRGVHLAARIEIRTLEICSEALPPSELLKRAGVVLFALDSCSREQASAKTLETIRRSATKVFKEEAGQVLDLLGEPSGALFRRGSLQSQAILATKRKRDGEIVRAISRLDMKSVVQFNCGRGGLLQRLIESGQFREIVGVEPSSTLAAHARSRLQSGAEVFSGSLLEPPTVPASDSLALLVDALPPSSDKRLERAVDVLFGEAGFEAVLCIEAADSPRWQGSQLDVWGASVAPAFQYQTARCLIEGCHAVLFRRGTASPERHRVRQMYVPEIQTRTGRSIQIELAQWKSTVEAFSKFTVDPRWLIYLPPGLCSIQTKQIDGPLEHPRAAFDYYRSEGISKVVVEFKHMGSRAIAIVCRDEAAGKRRFGTEALGCIYTRNGRPFWEDSSTVLSSLRDGLDRARFWERFDTDWVCLDGEMLPWTLKAESLIEESHGEMLVCGEAMIEHLSTALSVLAPNEVSNLDQRRECLRRYRMLYERYLTQADEAYRFAPFHLIATEGHSYFDRNHNWHMEVLKSIVQRAGDPFSATAYRTFSVDDAAAIDECCRWWEELSQSGAEGVVVKPLYFVPRGRRGMAQPGIKCRGVEHLRMVYGPEYDLIENRWALAGRDALTRRRERHRRILKQLAVSVEGVERFVRGEPLDRVESCARAVLALDQYEG